MLPPPPQIQVQKILIFLIYKIVLCMKLILKTANVLELSKSITVHPFEIPTFYDNHMPELQM